MQIAGLVVVFDELTMWSGAAHGRQLKMLESWNQAIGRKELAGRALAEPVAPVREGIQGRAGGNHYPPWATQISFFRVLKNNRPSAIAGVARQLSPRSFVAKTSNSGPAFSTTTIPFSPVTKILPSP